MWIMIYHSVQEEWIFCIKQLELAKFYYKHFQSHSIDGAGNVLHVALDKALPASEHLAQHSSAHLRDIQLRIA